MLDFETYRKRRLVDGKAEADLLNWWCIGIFVGVVSVLVPASPECLDAVHPFLGPDDEGGWDLCESAHQHRLLAVAWLVFSALRVFFLASRRQAGPLLLCEGLRLNRRDGADLSVKDAVRYALVEWLPVHVLSIYVLVAGAAESLYALAVSMTVTATAQIIWLAPLAFKYRGRNIAEWLTGVDAVFTVKGEEKVARAYERYRTRRLKITARPFNAVSYGFLMCFLLFNLTQIVRMPPINPDYERALYDGWDVVWEDNANIAFEGLRAPARTQDWYGYGRDKVMRQYLAFEVAKKKAGIAQAAPPPGAEMAWVPPHADELSLVHEEWKELRCLYDRRFPRGDECASAQDVKNYIADNRIMWERFARLPDYTHYSVIPRALGGSIEDPHNFARLKAAEIVVMAQEGAVDRAFEEWARYMRLYQKMGAARDTMVMKAVISSVIIREHLDVFETLINRHPELAVARAQEIDEALAATDGMVAVDNMLADDLALVEPVLLWQIGSVNAIRNDMYECVRAFEKLAQTPVREYPYGEQSSYCPYFYPFSYGYALMKPGVFVTNIIETLVMGGVLKGQELMGAIKQREAQVRTMRLGLAALREGVAAADMASYIAAAPETLRNPMTGEAFLWDAQAQEIYFIALPDKGARRAFRVPLP